MRARFSVLLLLVLALASAPFAAAEPDDNPLKAAKDLIKKQRYDEAIVMLTQAINADAGNADLYERRAQAYLESGKGAEALQDYTAAIKLEPADRTHLVDRAKAFETLGRTAEGISDCTRALDMKRDASILQLRAALYEKAGQMNEALQDYNELIKGQPFRGDYFVARGRVYRAAGQAQQASEDFGRAIRLNSTYRVQITRILSESSVRPAVVKPTLANIVPEAKPAAPEVLAQPERTVVVKAKKESKDKDSKASKSGSVQTLAAGARKPVPVEPTPVLQAKSEANVETVNVAVNIPPAPKAAPAAAATPQPAPPSQSKAGPEGPVAPSVNSAMQKGLVQIEAKQYVEAVASFTVVVDARPKSADGYVRRCMANFLAGNLKPAMDDCDKALTLKPADGDAHYYRGRVLQAQKSYRAAVDAYTAAISAKPYFPDAFYYRAQAAQSMDDLAVAIYNYSEAARQRKGFTEALQARADIKLQLGDRLGYQRDLDQIKAIPQVAVAP